MPVAYVAYIDESGDTGLGLVKKPDDPRGATEWLVLAALVVKILRGARPEDLPIQQPTHLDFIVNLKTASEIGFSVPVSLLDRADEVIE